MSKLIKFEIKSGVYGNIGHITLNKPQALNAINIEMIDAMDASLDVCANDENIKCVFISGAGDKAFCAGGDVIGLYHSMQATTAGNIPKLAMEFFTKEYKLDYRLHTFSKPIIAWGDGIVMGGGIGILGACSHRIVTEKSMLAMPEVTIGLYPDVAASWFFNRMPANIGMYLGLTGARLNAHDALFVKLADFFVLNEFKGEVLDDLSEIKWTDDAHSDVHNAIQSHASFSHDEVPVSNIRENYDAIQYLFEHGGLAAIVHNLTHVEPQSKWLSFGQKGFLKGCPLTYRLVYEQIKRAKHMSLKQVFAMELIMSTRCAMNLDLTEGIRALLIDKDGKPNWSVNSVSEVTEKQIQQYFTAPWSGEHPLN
ncbi:3-hydroxyisobutyryl-CoA hydrolase [hydrothermal vent metagenome]|uniref:3-hydroxyisobutyryl-CoA hydrolase n=1 Tax=hydrothermal vent metagenome TaxID=652676 RepID=A0A3B0V4A9_9ZZZZ